MNTNGNANIINEEEECIGISINDADSLNKADLREFIFADPPLKEFVDMLDKLDLIGSLNNDTLMQLLELFRKTQLSDYLREKGIPMLENDKWNYVGETGIPIFRSGTNANSRYFEHRRNTGDKNLKLQSLVRTDSQSFCSMLEQFYITEFTKISNKPGGPKMLEKSIRVFALKPSLSYTTYVCSYDEFSLKDVPANSLRNRFSYFPADICNQHAIGIKCKVLEEVT